MNIDHAFTDAYGAPPAGVWAAPGRVNLIGEHTDYNDGYVLPLALPLRVVAALRPGTNDELECRSAQHPEEPAKLASADLEPGSVPGWASYVAGVAWALRDAGYDIGGAQILIDSDLPVGSGLASSAALECSVALAFNELYQLAIPRDRLALVAQRAENVFVGMPCGIMDQFAALLCEAGSALFVDTRTQETLRVPFELERAGLVLLVIDTNAPHRLVEGEYAARRRSCEEAAAILGARALRDIELDRLGEALSRLPDETLRKRVRHVVSENARVLETLDALRAEDFTALGRDLTASHVSLRDDYEVSCPELDVAVEAALDGGALGARMTGGGFGGCAIALVAADRVDSVTAALATAYRQHGFRPAHVFTAVPSAGATRLR